MKEVLDRVKSEGDRAVIEYEERFDKVKLDALAVTEAEMAEAEKDVPIELKAAIMLAQKNIHAFHAAQRFEGKKVQTVPGVTCWQKAVADVYKRQSQMYLFFPYFSARAIASVMCPMPAL